MSNAKAIRDERIERIRAALLELAVEDPRASYTLKELAGAANIPYSAVRGLVEHTECWRHIDWTRKEITIRKRNYNTFKGTRMVDSLRADRRVLADEIKRLRASQVNTGESS